MKELLKKIYENKRLTFALKAASHFASFCAFLLFCLVCIRALFVSPISAVKLCADLCINYVVVSLARKIINAPRPYEVYDFYKDLPKNKKGLSFPSRHTFFMFAIATLCFPAAPFLSGILFVLGIFLMVSRVLTGIHFIRDVFCGAILGIVCSLLGLLIFSPF